MDTVEHWWNGTWGRLVRRDVWLRTDGQTWEVEAGRGGMEGRSAVLTYPDEAQARQELSLLLGEYGPWQRLSSGRM